MFTSETSGPTFSLFPAHTWTPTSGDTRCPSPGSPFHRRRKILDRSRWTSRRHGTGSNRRGLVRVLTLVCLRTERAGRRRPTPEDMGVGRTLDYGPTVGTFYPVSGPSRCVDRDVASSRSPGAPPESNLGIISVECRDPRLGSMSRRLVTEILTGSRGGGRGKGLQVVQQRRHRWYRTVPSW